MTDPLSELLWRSRQLGFLGPGAVDAQIHHATAFSAAVTEPPARALDLGAGGGVPGLVLAVTHWPDTRWCLLDAQLKRTDFLREAIEELHLEDRVEVVTTRAEELGRDVAHREAYDLIVSRSFGPPAVTAECAAPLLAPGGVLVVSEPPTGTDDRRWPSDAIAEFGFAPAEAVTTVGHDGTPVHLARLRRRDPVPDRYPRRVGIPAKRPRF